MDRRQLIEQLRAAWKQCRALEATVELLIEQAEEANDNAYGGWIDQKSSQFGPRKHREIVKARLARREEGAAILRRRLHLLSPEAYAEEIGRFSRGTPIARMVKAGASPARARELADFQRAALEQLKG